MSHSDEYKTYAHAFAKAIEPYGVPVFVAHDSIMPMKKWQKEIRNGLSTMEAMLVLLTDDFRDSSWTDQEIGFALGRSIPVICLKVGCIDPGGFVGSTQALIASLDNIDDAAPLVVQTLINEFDQAERIKDMLIDAFVSSISYIDAIENLERLKKTVAILGGNNLDRIIEGYARNDQLHGCHAIHRRSVGLQGNLEDATGMRVRFENGNIRKNVSRDEAVVPS